MRYLKGLILSLPAILFMNGCTDDHKENADKSLVIDANELALDSNKESLKKRIIANFEDINTTKATRAGGDVTNTLHEDAPEIPADAQLLKDQPTNYNGGVTLYKAGATGTYWNGSENVSYSATGKYYVPAGETWSGSISINDPGEDGIDIYIAGNVSTDLLWWNGGKKVNIYILPGAEYSYALDGGDNKAHVRNGTTIKCWGEFNVYKNKDDQSTKYGLRIQEGSAFYLFSGSSEQLYIPDNGAYTDNFNLGAATLEVQGGFFYSEIPVYIGGSSLFNGGEAIFVSTFQTDGKLWPENDTHVTFGECATIGETTWFPGSAATLDVYTCLTTRTLNTSDHPNDDIRIVLHSSLLKVLEDAFMEDESNKNHIIGDGTQYSVFNVLGTLYLNASDWAMQDGYRYGDITSIQGLVDVYVNNMHCGSAYWKPVSSQWDNYDLEPTRVQFEDFVLIDGGTYLPGGSSGCGQFGTPPEVELKGLLAIMPPTGEHRFSATGLDFNDELVYLGWHSNPKIENVTGGYMDVIRIDRYNAIENSLFEQSLYSTEFRFNHTKYYDGVVFGAATSTKVGAALAKIALDENGMIQSYPEPEVRRISLYGKSANCIEVINNQLVSVSGWSEGALQTTSMTAAKPENTYYEGNYQGKYIYHNPNTQEIIVLHNTTNGTIDIYDENGSFTSPKLSFNAGIIEPYDGKNVCISDSDYIYVCRGFNGLSIFDKTGKLVAQTSIFDEGGNLDPQTSVSANGVDVDDRYIYVAAGFGIIVLDKNDITGDEVVTLTPKAKSIMVERSTLQNTPAQIGASANFIRKGADGRLYVAYGVYGLRIYELQFE